MSRLNQVNNKLYLNKKMVKKKTVDFYVTVGVHSFALLSPITLAFFFGLGFLAFYILSAFILILFWGVVSEEGGLSFSKMHIKSYARVVHYTHGEVGDLVRALVEINLFEKELATLVSPESLYHEVMDKVENYDKLVSINAQDRLEISSYIKNLKNLTKACREIRASALTQDDQVLTSALTIAGINQEDK